MSDLVPHESVPPQARRETLTRRAFGGFVWTFAQQAGEAVMKIGVLAVLARVLSPADFGVVSAALVVVAFAEVFGRISLGPALVQLPHLTPAHIRTAFTLTFLLGCAIGVATYAVAPLIASLFQMPSLEPIVAGLALVFPIKGIAVVSESLLQRHMRFRSLATVEFFSYALGYAPVAIALALAGIGVWALVAGQLALAAVASIGFILSERHAMRPQIDGAAVKQLLRFGVGQTLARFGNFVATNIDYMIVGRVLGVEALGFYTRAYYFMMQPTALIGAVGEKVLFPALATVQSERTRVLQAYYRSLALVALTTFPLSAVLVVFAPEIIHILLGDRWDAVVVPFQILLLSLTFRTAYKVTGTLMRASGFVYLLAAWQWIYAAGVGAGAFIGHYFGLEGVAVGVSIAIAANFWVGVAFARASCGVSATRILGIVARHGLVSAVLLGLMVLVRGGALAMDLPAIVTIAAGGLGASIFALAAWFLLPGLFGDEGKWVRSVMVGEVRNFFKLPVRKPAA